MSTLPFIDDEDPVPWLCRHGHHTRRWRQVPKFNGGNICWLCGRCHTILRYRNEEYPRLRDLPGPRRWKYFGWLIGKLPTPVTVWILRRLP